MALVSQEPTLYAGTIRFNILLGAIKPHSEVTQDEIESACRDANILEFIQGLPEYVPGNLVHPCSDANYVFAFVEASILKLVAKVRSYQEVKSVS